MKTDTIQLCGDVGRGHCCQSIGFSMGAERSERALGENEAWHGSNNEIDARIIRGCYEKKQEGSSLNTSWAFWTQRSQRSDVSVLFMPYSVVQVRLIVMQRCSQVVREASPLGRAFVGRFVSWNLTANHLGRSSMFPPLERRPKRFTTPLVAAYSQTPRPLSAKRVTEDPETCTERLLEWDELCAHVSRFASTGAGKKACRRLRRGDTFAEALELQAETRAVDVFAAELKVEFDFGPLSTELVSSGLDRGRRGGMLSGQQLRGLSSLIAVSKSLQKAMSSPFRKSGLYREQRRMTEVIYRPWAETEIESDLLNLINFAIDEDGSIKDTASEDVARTRAEFRRIKNKLESILRSSPGEIVVRSGRLCLAMPSGNAIPSNALVLDAGSHGTVYCEPRSALTLNNDLSVSYAEMKNAEESLLWNLTSEVVDRLDHLATLLQLAVDLDTAIARYRYTEWIDGSFPQFSYVDGEGGEMVTEEASLFLSLINLRHPLLLGQSLIYEEANARRQYRDSFRLLPPVPNDVILTAQTKALVITGPNAGGKTATLKALGLCALMAKAGLGLPAKQPVWIPFYSSVLADIGDEQSLTSSLSTFSGHLHRIQNLREVADGKCLILLDELGTGTDPKEGAALGAALLKKLVQGGHGGALTTVVSTHHGLMKNLAYEQQQEDENGIPYSVFENASMEFDDEALAPTYRLIMGVPGQSNALNIASRLGMDLRIIGAAKSRLGRRHISENILISKIQNEQEGLESISDHLEKLEKKIEHIKTQTRDLEQRTATMQFQISSQEADDYRAAYERGKEELETLKHRSETESAIPESGPEPEAPSNVDRAADKRAATDWVPSVGDVVFVPDIGKEATLIKLTSKNKAVIRTGFLTITVESATLQPL